MEVRIVDFPETPIAVIEHRGPPALEHDSVRKLVSWRIENRMMPDKHRTFGVHYDDPRATQPEKYRVDFCIEVDHPVVPNNHGVINKIIPAGRCAVARHFGSRDEVTAASWLYEQWLPRSGEALRDFPIFFHYVNVGPGVEQKDMITDVYLPLR